MNTTNTTIIAVIALIIGAAGLLAALLRYQLYTINVNDFISLVGVLITATAFAMATYFVVVAVSAYSHVRDIEKIKAETLRTRDSVAETQAYMGQMRLQFVDMMDKFVSEQITISEIAFPTVVPEVHKDTRRRRTELYRRRSNLALDYPFMAEDRRINLIRELASVGTTAELSKLRELVRSGQEGDAVRRMAETVIEELEKLTVVFLRLDDAFDITDHETFVNQ